MFGGCINGLADSAINISQPTYLNPGASINSENTPLTEKAKQWGLTASDYEHYQWLLTHTPSGQWYKDLDPPEILALNATTPEALREYTKIVVKNTHDRVEHELNFNHAFGEMFREMYPNENPIELSANKVFSQESGFEKGDRLWLFVDIQSPSAVLLKTLITFISKYDHVTLDVYIVGENIKAPDIENWAEKNDIPVNLVNKLITLNFGNQRYQEIKRQQNIILPYVARFHLGHLQPVAISSFL